MTSPPCQKVEQEKHKWKEIALEPENAPQMCVHSVIGSKIPRNFLLVAVVWQIADDG
jgi:hypothetical protein